MADSLDDKVNKFFKNLAILPNPSDPFFLLTLLSEIADDSDGRLNTNGSFLKGMIFDPDKGPSLKEKLAKAWDKKKYQSIRDIGRF